MDRYEGLSCPKCGKAFTPEDQIAVCPICGTPQHAECYRELGHCVHEDWHEAGRKYDAEAERAAADPRQEETVRVQCPRCGEMCEQGSAFCKRCGLPMMPQGFRPNPNSAEQDGPEGQPGPGFRVQTFVIPPYAGLDPEEELTEGVTVKDYADFIGPGNQQFLFRFKRLAQGSTFSLNLLFGIGNVFYLLYRKMYKLGIPLLIYMALFLGVNLATTLLVTQQVYAAIDSASSIAMSDLYTMMDVAMRELPVWLYNLYNALHFTVLPLILALGIFGDKLFFTHCTDRIREIKQANPENTAEALKTRGGVNRPLMLAVLAIAAGVSMLTPLFSAASMFR